MRLTTLTFIARENAGGAALRSPSAGKGGQLSGDSAVNSPLSNPRNSRPEIDPEILDHRKSLILVGADGIEPPTFAL